MPPELLPTYCHVHNQLVLDAPTGDIEFEAEALTPEIWLEREDQLRAARRLRSTVVALDGDRQVVGYSDVSIPLDDPENVHQWGTLVRRDHRGHRLGLALKARNLLDVQREHPGRTGGAHRQRGGQREHDRHQRAAAASDRSSCTPSSSAASDTADRGRCLRSLVWRIVLWRKGFRLWTTFPPRSNRCTMAVMVGTGDGEQAEAERLEAERLEAELAVVCGQLNQVSARLVAVTARAIACEGWAGAGIRSVEHWLVLRAGLSPVRARQVVLMARRVGVLPVVMGQFAAGRLSVDQVAVVARHAPSHVEASVAELAVSASVPQLGRVLSRYAFDPPTGDDPDPGPGWRPGRAVPPERPGLGVEPALDEGGRAGEPAELSMGVREGGRFELRFSAPADVGALVEAAVSEARDALFGAGVPQVTWADALVQVCDRSLGSVTTRGRQESFRVYVHLDAEGGWLNGRPRLPEHLVAKLTCAGTVQPLWQAAGVPVSVGRALRIVPERTRRLVLDRDRGCRFPGCVARAHLEVHHVVHWAERRPGGTWTTWPGCVRSTTTPTTVASSRSPAMRTLPVGWCSWPAAGSRSGRARPTPRHVPQGPAPTPGSAGRVYTIGVSTPDPVRGVSDRLCKCVTLILGRVDGSEGTRDERCDGHFGCGTSSTRAAGAGAGRRCRVGAGAGRAGP